MTAERNPKIGRARAILVRLSDDERARLLAESREKGRRDFEARMKDAITTGLTQGRAEGREEGQAAVLALIDEGLSPAEIKARLGLR